jgi:hypothetical protein
MTVDRIPLENYDAQVKRWPVSGQHILAHFDESTIVVYQAYRASIGEWAVTHQTLGGPDFSFGRMSWIKPNFLWMMYRSGWGTKEGQTHVLGLRVTRRFFDDVLTRAVPSTFPGGSDDDRARWQAAVQQSDVRSQWDPDHLPNGAPTERRAIQLGLRGEILRALTSKELVEVIDMNTIVARGRDALSSRDVLETPNERVYDLASPGPTDLPAGPWNQTPKPF